jgi:hypothetical protein
MPNRKALCGSEYTAGLISKSLILYIKITGKKVYVRKNDRTVYGNG